MRPIAYRPRRRHGLFSGVGSIGTAAFVIALAFSAGYINLRDGPDVGTMDVAGTFDGYVTKVVDGDTFRISSRSVRIRVWGLDAPEVGTPGGSEATTALSGLIAGELITCRQRDTDRYGRIVGQCFLADGRDVTAAMIASGAAKEYCRFSANHYGTC